MAIPTYAPVPIIISAFLIHDTSPTTGRLCEKFMSLEDREENRV